jgi:hypothetical protein
MTKDVTAYVGRFEKLALEYEYANNCKRRNLYEYVPEDNVSRCVIERVRQHEMPGNFNSQIIDLQHREFEPLSEEHWKYILQRDDEYYDGSRNYYYDHVIRIVQKSALQIFEDYWVITNGHGYGEIVCMSNDESYLRKIFDLWHILTSCYRSAAMSESWTF